MATEVGRRLQDARLVLVEGATVEGRVVAPALLAPGCSVGPRALVGDRSALGEGVTIG